MPEIDEPYPACADSADGRTLYLDLMKRCLTCWIYADVEQNTVPIRPQGLFRRLVVALVGRIGLQLVRTVDLKRREEGRDWPSLAHTMIGLKRLDNLQHCVEEVLKEEVPGDLIETGVWRGGAAIFMRAILKAHGDRGRCVWLADSFEGLPTPKPEKCPHDASSRLHQAPELAVPLERVRANFSRYGLLDDRVRFLKGWFCDTLPAAPIERLAVLRLDGDLYESTTDALTHLYPKLSVGGYVIVDDYGGMTACRHAIHDYRDKHGITDEILPIDWTGVYWRRTR
jgi:hypothetical protein